jgi:CheY-like chemotaxis protein
MSRREVDMVNIVLAEDNPRAVRLVRERFRDARALNEMAVATDGKAALPHLFRQRERKPQEGQRFVTKPVHSDRFVDVTRSLEQFWLPVVKLPTPNARPPGDAS